MSRAKFRVVRRYGRWEVRHGPRVLLTVDAKSRAMREMRRKKRHYNTYGTYSR